MARSKAFACKPSPRASVVHPETPLTVVRGPIAMAQILETPLLSLLSCPMLIAAKAARLREVAKGSTVLEFGLRRGPERGSNAAARAALLGGADFGSNVGLSHIMGLPPKGTHAHSMVQVFMALGEGELAAFRARAEPAEMEPLLVDVLVAELPELDVLRARRVADVARLDPGVRRLVTPHIYHVSLSERLWDLKQALIREAKG